MVAMQALWERYLAGAVLTPLDRECLGLDCHNPRKAGCLLATMEKHGIKLEDMTVAKQGEKSEGE